MFNLLNRGVLRRSIFEDGADYYGSDPTLKWTAGNGSAVDLTGTNSRTGIGAVECQGTQAPSQSIPLYTDYFVGVGAKCQSLGSGVQTPIILTRTGVSIQMQLQVLTNGAVSLVQGPFGPTLATSAGGLVIADQYAYIELGYSSSAQTASVRVNGVQVIPPTAFTLGLGPVDIFTMAGPGGGLSMWIDDVYVNDNTIAAVGNPNNSFSGPVRLYPGVPVSDSTPLQWSPSSGSAHFSLVDSIPPNGGVNYVFSNTPGQIDQYIYGVPAGLTPPVNVLAFCVSLLAEIDVAGGRSIAAQIGATQGAAVALTTSYHIVSTQFDVNPVTGNQLLLTDLPTLPVGPVVVS